MARVQIEVFGLEETPILFAGARPVNDVQLRYVKVDIDEFEVATQNGFAGLEVVEKLAAPGGARYGAQERFDACQKPGTDIFNCVHI